jgi:hypothetical protein
MNLVKDRRKNEKKNSKKNNTYIWGCHNAVGANLKHIRRKLT